MKIFESTIPSSLAQNYPDNSQRLAAMATRTLFITEPAAGPIPLAAVMIRAGLMVAILLLTYFQSPGQERLDSLRNLYQSEKNDSIRFLLLHKLSEEAEFTDYRKCREYADESAALAEKLGAWALGKLLLRLAFLETMEGDYTEALEYDLQGVALYAQERDSFNLAKAYVDVGADYRDIGEYDEAYSNLVQGFRIAKNAPRVPKAIDSLTMLVALHNMGTLFTELSQYDIAFQHLLASQAISEAIDDEDGPAYFHDEVGELHRKKGEFEKAEKDLLKAQGEARRLKIRFLLPRIQTHLANLYLDKGDYNRALLYFDSVRSGQTNINSPFVLADCDLGTGQVMAKLGNYPEALRRYQAALKTSRQLNARNLTLSAYNAMASVYEIMKDYQKALSFHRQHDALRDSMFSKTAMERLLSEQIRFTTMNKDLEIEALSQLQQQQTSEIRRQELVQNVLVVVAVLSIFLLYTVFRSGRRRKRINRLLLEHQEEIKRRSLELQQLNQVKDKFFSIISHDLRSPMSALAGTLDLLNKQKITPEEFAALTQALRIQFNHTRTLINNLLDWTLLQMDKLKIQKEQVNLFRTTEDSFEALRNLYPKNIQFENRIDPQLTGFADPNILSLVLRNLILNAIKFTELGGRVWVQASETEAELTISVCDNGTGIKPEIQEFLFTKTSSYSTRGTANEKGTGLGLILCKEFVEKNGGKIWLESEIGKGSIFYFTLPKYRKPVLSVSTTELIAN